MATALREILANFSFTADTEKLTKIDEQVSGLAGNIAAVAALFAGGALLRGVAGFVKQQAEVGAKLDDTSNRLGLNIDELQRFQYQAQLTGGSSEEAAKGLSFLNKNVGAAILGNKGAIKTFAQLGVALRNEDGSVKTLAEILPEVTTAFTKVGSEAEQAAFGQKIFGKGATSLLPLLKETPKTLAAMSKEYDELGGGLSKKFVRAAAAADDQFDRLQFASKGLKSELAVNLLPTVETFTQSLTKGVVKLREYVTGTNILQTSIIALSVVMGAAAVKLSITLIGAVSNVIKSVGYFKTAIMGLTTLGVVLAIAAIVFAIDELYTTFTGGESLITDWLDAWGGVGTAKKWIDDISDSWTKFGDALSQSFFDGKSLREIFSDAGKWGLDYLVGAIVQIVESLTYAVQLMTKLVNFVAHPLDAIGTSGLPDKIGDALDAMGFFKLFPGQGSKQDIQNFKEQSTRNEAGRAVQNAGPISHDFIGAPQTSVPYGPPREFKPISVTNSHTVNVTVKGGDDPRANGQAVAAGAQEALDAANQDALGALLNNAGSD